MGAIVFLAVLLLGILVIYIWNEYASMKNRQAEEERRTQEREAELRAHLHHKPKPEDKQP